ncbi:MAG TPA: PD-(D/E)XK nuclease family transposase [Kofleriaceae bacterium]|nr:PD-(D/E)XK nuclease family transposase [Kofleriaceae bacterium]
MQYAFLELPKYAAGNAPQSLVDRWAYFFREAKNLRLVPPALSEDPFRGALEVARTATFSPEEWETYERAKMAEQDARGALAVARQEGAQAGLAKGLEAGARRRTRQGQTGGTASPARAHRARAHQCDRNRHHQAQ